MEDRAQDWMVAAACSQGPRAQTTFATLPRAYREEMLRLALVAAASSAFFIALAILLRPLPSRSLAAHALLPDPSTPRAAALEARLTIPTEGPSLPRVRRPRAVHASYDIAPAEISAVDIAPDAGAAAAPARRRNVLTRFFRGMLGRSAAPTQKTDFE